MQDHGRIGTSARADSGRGRSLLRSRGRTPYFADHPAIRVLHWKLRKGRFLSDSASVRVQCEHAQARKIEIVVLRGDGSQARRSWSPCAFGKRADFNADLGYGEARWIELRLLGPQRSELARIRRDVRFPD